jgi:beta-1,4-mannosyl-glycoprotein beta-1,4-N-acetylglucosaminyltransferase
MIYDCFAFFNELDLLEIRLNELDKVVDKFVLIEATRTFQKQPKPLYFEENKERFASFLPKIIHIKLDHFPNFFYKFRVPRPWDYDNYQKDQIAKALVNCSPDDIIIYSDLDEIPNAKKIIEYKHKPGFKVFQMKHFYYYLNGLEVEKDSLDKPVYWNGSVMCFYKDFSSVKKLRMQRDIKKYPKNILIEDGGWHFAYLGGVEKIIQKISSYAHTEHNTAEFKNQQRILERINQGKGLYDDSISINYLKKIDDTYPDYLVKNQLKFSHLIKNER